MFQPPFTSQHPPPEQSPLDRKYEGMGNLIGKSCPMQGIFESIRRLQQNHLTVLITGESGTGKELIARRIHDESPRAASPFVPLNCAAIPHGLAESILFGHARGAFTGALMNHKGYFEQANGGTLFLDEIGEMPARLQSKLLRVLEDGVVVPVGATAGRRVNVRVIAATNTDLQAKVLSGAFRQDLYFRLAQFTMVVPPLRARQEDIPLLADYFLNQLAADMQVSAPPFSPQALEALMAYPFPGNVRELKHIIGRALMESHGSAIHPEHLHFTPLLADRVSTATAASETAGGEVSQPATSPLAQMLEERDHIQRVFAHNRYNISVTARQLGISRQALYRLMAKYGIPRQRTP